MKRLIALWLVSYGLSAGSARAADPYPFDLKLGREAALFAGGAALLATGAMLAGDSRSLSPAELAALDAGDLLPLDRGSTANWSPVATRTADRALWVVVTAPVGLMIAGPGSERGGRLFLMYAETMMLSGGVTAVLKHLTDRPRPFVYNPDPRIPDSVRLSHTARRSFPSGHTVQSFTAMVFFASVYEQLHPENSGWVWAGCVGSAATIGWLRHEAGYHFATDILAGAAIGAATGWLVPRLHEAGGDPEAGMPTGARFTVGFAF